MESVIQAPEIHKFTHSDSILSLSVIDTLLFAGTQGNEILVYDLTTYQRVASLKGHGGSVLCLATAPDKSLLFSAATDSLVKIWDTDSLEELYTIYSLFDVGDIFTISYSTSLETVFFGTQNASIHWCNLPTIDNHASHDRSGLPSNRFSKFFDSKGPGGKTSLRQLSPVAEVRIPNSLIEIPSRNVIQYAHNGYIYCMQTLVTSNGDEYLFTGSGDGMVNLWSMRTSPSSTSTLTKIHSLENGHSVLCMTICDTFLYVGQTGGDVSIWDLDTLQMIKTVSCHSGDVLSISAFEKAIFTGCAGGNIKTWTRELTDPKTWHAHDGLILSAVITKQTRTKELITGASDQSIGVWNISELVFPPDRQAAAVAAGGCFEVDDRQMLETLYDLVAFRTISSDVSSLGESRRCATFLKNLFTKFGASSHLIPTSNSHNPIVYARFNANFQTRHDTAVILYYGHYDVVSADSYKWNSDPFKMSSHDGYVYGRGVSDNKGPILASLFAAGKLFQEERLSNDIIFLLEGEEEQGGAGFEDAIRENKHLFTDVDWILLSNSYWLNDAIPCLNYGLRGVVRATVQIVSDSPDLHSGVDGGVGGEPLMDMTKLLSRLTGDDGRVLLPGFYDTVQELSEQESKLYDEICLRVDKPLKRESLIAKWRNPSLTIHSINVSTSSQAASQTIIPRLVTATMSLRIVPDQSATEIAETLRKYLSEQFAKIKSQHHLSVKIVHAADPWLGDYTNHCFQLLSGAIQKTWNMKEPPLFIREGGTIPGVRILEKIVGAPAAQVPCGQASDSGHLDNERVRVLNLVKAREIWSIAFRELSSRSR
ncbi:uncharacterized protein V1510DRAFT_368013 [Dipodascopsis tothii]|uniref:uncharacterized protein n=1 Tax=Dipodascopsis tothii TaxID=44089 RepID=UPI0034CE2D46